MSFAAKKRAEESASRVKADWEKGCVEDFDNVPPRQADSPSVVISFTALLNEIRHQVRQAPPIRIVHMTAAVF